MVVIVHHHAALVEHGVDAAVAADGQALARPHLAVQRDGGLLARGDGVDGELGPGARVAAHEHVGFARLVRQAVGLRRAVAVEVLAQAHEQVAPQDGLSDGDEHAVGLDRDGLFLVVPRREPAVPVEHGRALFELYCLDPAVLYDDALRAPAVVDFDAFLAGLLYLVGRGGHLLL